MIVLGTILFILGTGVLVAAITIVINQLSENDEDHFDFIEHLFNKRRTVWTDVLSKLIMMMVFFFWLIFSCLGIKCFIIAGAL